MRRHGHLIEKIYQFENLELAFRKASRGHRYTPGVLRFRENLEENLIQLQNEIIWREYKPRPFRSFVIYEPKMRVIQAAAFRDRVVHHAIMNILEPIWEGLFIHTSFACRKNKGTHAGVLYLDKMLKSAAQNGETLYCLKGDVSKFFPSINHAILMRIIQRKIKCSETLALLEKIIYASGDKADPDSHDLAIGNLISQWCANLYLNELDYFIKHTLRAKHYTRYMDDTVILHHDKRQLARWQDAIAEFLQAHLNLRVNPKTSIFPVSHGIDYLGYRTWRNRRLLRKSAPYDMLKRIKRLQHEYAAGLTTLLAIAASMRSWIAHCDFSDSYGAKRKILRAAVF